MSGFESVDVCIVTEDLNDLVGFKNESHLINLYISTNHPLEKNDIRFKSISIFRDKDLPYLISQGASKYIFFSPEGLRLKENTIFHCLTQLMMKKDHGVVAIPSGHFRHSCLGFAVADVCFMLREAYSYNQGQDFSEEVTINAIFNNHQVIYLNAKYFDCGEMNINHSGSLQSMKDSWLHQFPENKFVPVMEEDYRKRVVNGYERMSKSKLVICGLARDVKHCLETTGIPRLEHLSSLFKDCIFVTYENDSRDATGLYLNDWSKKDPDKRICMSESLSLERIGGRLKERTERLAHCRNICLDKIIEIAPDFDYYIPVDLDLIGGFSYDGIAHSISHDDWSGMGSNGKNTLRKSIWYWDKFPHRDLGHSELRISRPQMMKYGSRYASLQRGDPLLEVNSCFGGMAVYKLKDVIESGARYSGETSDHEVFNKAITDNGGRIFLNPSQVLLYNYMNWCEDHNGDSFRI